MSKQVNINHIHYKECSHCHKLHPLSNFHACSDCPDGLHYICKPCTAELNKINREKRKQERPFHSIWRRIMDACYNMEHWNQTEHTEHSWRIYGGRGIEVSEEFHCYEIFAEYIQEIYEKDRELYGPNVELWIDRIDVNGHYERGNLRFVSPIESAMNRRESQYELHEHVGPNGRMTMPLAWWARIYQIEAATVTRRLDKGWSLARALNEPVEMKFSKNITRKVIECKDQVTKEGKKFFLNGNSITLNQLYLKFGIHPSTFKARINSGMSIMQALTTQTHE